VLARFAGQASLALRNATLYEAAEERRREAESLAELGRAVASLDPRHVLETIAARIPDLAGTPGGAVALVMDDGRVRFAAYRGLPAEFAAFEPRHPRDGVTASAISERRPVWSADVLNDPAVALSPPSRDFIETHGRRAVLAVPIVGGERALGALVAVRSEAGPFTPEQVRRLEAAAAHAAVAIENARLYEEAETRRREAEIVARITRSVGASLDLDRILQQVAEGARELCRSDMARIALPEAGSEGMTFRYWVGARYPGYAGVRVEAGQGVGGQVMVTGQPFRTDDWVRDPRISKETLHVVQAEGVVAMLAVPIRIAERIEGLLYVENRSPRPFVERDEVVLTQLADQAALALHNARLFAGEQEARRVAERSEERFREGEALFRGAFEGAATGMVLQAPDGRYLRANRVFCEMIGYSEAELWTRTWQELTHPADLSTEPNERLLRREISSYTLEKRYRHRDGHDVWALVGVALVRDGQGQPQYFVVQVQDITERKHSAAVRERLEGELRQAQKMEAIGRLSGGIAHDFNNLLAVIMGHSELLASRLTEADPAQQDAEMIRRASERAAELTRQLLAFGRRQPQEPRVLDLNALVTSLLSMLQRLIGADVQLVTRLAPDLGRVRADPGQIEQVLMNLVVNARDSMPQGGRLTLTTDNVLLGASGDVSPVGPAAQAHVRLGVEDTGIGMSEETQAHVFEPFFTTKGPDKGTGLGLSTAYGIVSQHQGRIEVRSGLGQGTTFWVYLPRIEEPLSAPVAPTTRAHLPGGSETILLVEDEKAVRELARQLLVGRGYTVLEAASGESALQLVHRHPDPIHLVLTDVVMPGMSGPELAERLAVLRPKTRVLYMSGYAEEALRRSGEASSEVRLLPKPFTMAALAGAVRAALDCA
jgi:PAS domain S-box-containing protein